MHIIHGAGGLWPEVSTHPPEEGRISKSIKYSTVILSYVNLNVNSTYVLRCSGVIENETRIKGGNT